MKIIIKFCILYSIILCCLFANDESPYVVVLGIAQDGGAPHAGCTKTCCTDRWYEPENHFRVSCLGIVDPQTNEVWMVDATPDFPEQYHALAQNGKYKLNGIFLTHAHVGHYTGLMHLGREVMGAKEIPVYAMPRMKSFLENNGPWDQLVSLKQIILNPLNENKIVKLNDRLSVTPFRVPHRDEYSETVGFQISGLNSNLIFIPDIDKWGKWENNINDVIKNNDYVLIDGTFFGEGEIPNRNMAEIPHPSIEESMNHFSVLSIENKSKVFFIHLNHTNPVLNLNSAQRKKTFKNGYTIAQRKQKFNL